MASGNPSARDIPLTLEQVLREEYEFLHGAAAPPADPGAAPDDRLRNLLSVHESSGHAALCLSGGGIRSASFNLGVLEGLARTGVLPGFDYLSTVSGGGYVGGWLSAWRTRAQADSKPEPSSQMTPSGRSRPARGWRARTAAAIDPVSRPAPQPELGGRLDTRDDHPAQPAPQLGRAGAAAGRRGAAAAPLSGRAGPAVAARARVAGAARSVVLPRLAGGRAAVRDGRALCRARAPEPGQSRPRPARVPGVVPRTGGARRSVDLRAPLLDVALRRRLLAAVRRARFGHRHGRALGDRRAC